MPRCVFKAWQRTLKSFQIFKKFKKQAKSRRLVNCFCTELECFYFQSVVFSPIPPLNRESCQNSHIECRVVEKSSFLYQSISKHVQCSFLHVDEFCFAKMFPPSAFQSVDRCHFRLSIRTVACCMRGFCESEFASNLRPRSRSVFEGLPYQRTRSLWCVRAGWFKFILKKCLKTAWGSLVFFWKYIKYKPIELRRKSIKFF